MRSREPNDYVFCAYVGCAVLLSSIFVGRGAAEDSGQIRAVRYEATWESLMRHNATPLWYEDAVLGFYFHWGPSFKRQMLAYYFNRADQWGKEVVVTSKKLWENRRQDLPPQISPLNLEMGFLPAPRAQKWQTDIQLGRTWAWTPGVGCKDVDVIVDMIVNNVNKNALTLFSVAPKADGSLPKEQVEGLKKLGDWMAINKPALYATLPASFARGGSSCDEYQSMRFMRKKEYLYVVDLERPEAPVVIPDVFPLEGSEIFMLGSERNLKWHVIPDEEDDEAGNLVIEELPDPLPCDYAWSFKIQVLEESW